MSFLTCQLRKALPEGILLDHEGVDVVIRYGDVESRNGTAVIIGEQDGRSLEQQVETAAHAILSHVQDAFCVATSRPWPNIAGPLPLPGADVTAGRLLTWFGAPDDPTLRLDPVDLEALSH